MFTYAFGSFLQAQGALELIAENERCRNDLQFELDQIQSPNL
jgi:hypothetical protein